MRCYNCDQPFRPGESVTLRIEGEIVNGKFEPCEDETIVHYPWCT